jgi:hypothetical protein
VTDITENIGLTIGNSGLISTKDLVLKGFMYRRNRRLQNLLLKQKEISVKVIFSDAKVFKHPRWRYGTGHGAGAGSSGSG